MSKSLRSSAAQQAKAGWQLETPLPTTKTYPFIFKKLRLEKMMKDRRERIKRLRKEAATKITTADQTKSLLLELEVKMESLKQQKQQIFMRLRSSLSSKPSQQSPQTSSETSSPGGNAKPSQLLSPSPRPAQGQFTMGSNAGIRPLSSSYSGPPRTPLSVYGSPSISHHSLTPDTPPQHQISSANQIKPCAMVRPTTKPTSLTEQHSVAQSYHMPARFSAPSQSNHYSARSSQSGFSNHR